MFDGCDFLAELTQHIPPKGVQYIRRYGLYASRTRGKWTEHPEIIRHAPSGWKVAQQESSGNKKNIDEEESKVSDRTSRKAWARLLTKVYEIDPMVCPKCGSEMKVIADIRNVYEIRKILKHPGRMAEQQPKVVTRLRKIGRPPPGVDYSNIAV